MQMQRRNVWSKINDAHAEFQAGLWSIRVKGVAIKIYLHKNGISLQSIGLEP